MLLLSDSLVQIFQLVERALNVLARGLQLRTIHQRGGAPEPPAGPPGDRHRHLQIPHQFHPRRRRGRTGLFLRFQKQVRLFQNPLPDTRCGIAPGRVDLPGLTGSELARGKPGGHALAVAQALARHRHQILHRHMRGDGALANFLLDTFRKQIHQRQPAGDPTHAPVEPSSQILQLVAEALLQFRKQPALFQRRFHFRKTHRAVQDQRLGFAHLPNRRLHRVPPQLSQRRYPLVAVNDQVTARLVLHGHDHDGDLLPRCRQRGQQPALTVRTPNP